MDKQTVPRSRDEILSSDEKDTSTDTHTTEMNLKNTTLRAGSQTPKCAHEALEQAN